MAPTEALIRSYSILNHQSSLTQEPEIEEFPDLLHDRIPRYNASKQKYLLASCNIDRTLAIGVA